MVLGILNFNKKEFKELNILTIITIRKILNTCLFINMLEKDEIHLPTKRF